jgi:hypothetical protein
MKRLRAGLLGAALATGLGCAQTSDGRFQRDVDDAASAPDVVIVDAVTRDVVTPDAPVIATHDPRPYRAPRSISRMQKCL